MRLIHRLPRLAAALAVAALAAPLLAAEPTAPTEEFHPPADSRNWVKLDVPYVPTPYSVVSAMLEIAQVKPDDILYDLGSGDGRIVITAARDYGVKKAVGIDLNPVRVKEANANAEAATLTDRVGFIEGDIFTENFAEASVVTMYLMPHVNLRLRPRLLDELKPGTRIVSHAFHMFDWNANAEAYINGAQVYLWIVPAKVAGRWHWRSGTDEYTLTLKQKFQVITGTLKGPAGEAPVNGRLMGTALTFDTQFAPNGKSVVFSGTVTGGAIVATVTVDGAAASVSAVPAH